MSNKVNQVVSKSFMSKYVNKETLKYVFTTHFWGPISNFGIPIAAMYDLKKDEDLISGSMTSALIVYSTVFMRYALAVTPKNYLLFGCHVLNTVAQTGQGFRYINYHYMGGKEKAEKEGEQKN